MSKLKPNVPEYKRTNQVFRHLMGGWSFIVWLVMILVTYLCYIKGGSFRPLNGQVQVIKENISSMETDRILQINIQPGQRVKSGEVIALLDMGVIDLKVEELKVQLCQDRTKLRQERLEAELNALDRQRRLMVEVQDLRKIINDAEMLQESDVSAHAVLADRFKVVSALLKKALVDSAEYDKARIALAAMEPKLNKYPEIIAQHKNDLAALLRLQQETEAASLILRADQVGQTPEANIESDPQMKEMLINKQNHTIRAASDGTIWRINFQAGEVIRAGDSIAEIIKDVDPIIETFVPETIAFQVVLGQEFRVSTLSAPATYYRATITAITPQIVGEIDTANSMINRIVRGRRLLLTPAEKTPMMPGESVMIEKVPKYWFF